MHLSPGPARTAGALPFVGRRRVVERLQDGVRGPLTVLSAPPGYGKSVVLGQWAEHCRDGPVARVTLRPGEAASRLAVRLVAALGRLGAPVPRDPVGLDGGEAGLGERAIACLAATMEQVPGGTLVLDDLDAPGDAALVDGVRSLVGLAPAGLHVLVAQRGRWPASDDHRRERVCLDESALAFTPDEVRELVRHVAGRPVADRQLEALLGRTWGWAVPLHLAAIALRGPVDADAVIENLTGDDRDLAGYVGAEVLDGLAPPVQRFLLRTSVLDRLCAPLCDELAGWPDGDGEVTLALVEQMGLFVRPSASGPGWFSYHPLFREVLRSELRRSEPGAETVLLARAADWHLARDQFGPAADHLIDAGDEARLLELIDRRGRTMFERGAAGEVLRWLDALPGSRDPRRTDLAIRRAYLQTMLGNTRLADQVVRDLDAVGLGVGERLAVDALSTTWTLWHASPESAIRAADAALAALDAVDARELPDVFGLTSPERLRLMAAGSRARALWYLGDVRASRRTLLALVGDPRAYPPWRVHVLGALALVEAWAGNLRAARRHARDALAVAAGAHLMDHPATIDARLADAHVARERDDLGRADALLADVHELATRSRRPVVLALHSVEQALWHLAAGHPERGLAVLERNRASGDPPPPAAVDARQRAAEVRLLVALGDVGRARSVLDRALRGCTPTPDLAAVAVQVAVAQRDIESAAAHLDGWRPDDVEPRTRLERELWLAIVAAECGDRRAARGRVAVVVAEAECEGHVRLFLDAGGPAEPLLASLHQASPSPYVRCLVERARSSRRAATREAPAGLSDRELEVVRYLPTALSNAEIAARLYISVNTLKTHLRSIYGKLGATGRRDAIERAQALGIA